MVIKTTDVWTEQHKDHQECFNGAFIDGLCDTEIPYDSFKIVLNCNCLIESNSNKIKVGNKHNSIIFYKGGKVVRLVVLFSDTDVFTCLNIAMDQQQGNDTLRKLLENENIKYTIVDLKQKPILNEHNSQPEMDIGSCDRQSLLESMLGGSYTESETNYGNYDSLEYDFDPNIEITYRLKTDKEEFEIPHKGAFITKDKNRAIIIQTQGSIFKDNLTSVKE